MYDRRSPVCAVAYPHFWARGLPLVRAIQTMQSQQRELSPCYAHQRNIRRARFFAFKSKRELFCFVLLCEIHMENPVRTNPPLPSAYPESALNKASSGAHAAVDSIAGAADEAARKAKPAIDQFAAIAHQAVDKAANAATPAAEWLNRQGEDLTAAQKQLVSDATKYISANPLKSVAIALAAGFVISRIVR